MEIYFTPILMKKSAIAANPALKSGISRRIIKAKSQYNNELLWYA
ncbi:hypothetical protein [Aetokthonos hydrillicola]